MEEYQSYPAFQEERNIIEDFVGNLFKMNSKRKKYCILEEELNETICCLYYCY